jgi:hypothetical protein
MNDPERLIDQPPDDLAGSILRAALDDEPNEHALKATAAALGVSGAIGGALAGAAAPGTAASSSAASKVGAAVLFKWLGIGLVSATAVAGGASWLTRHSPKHAARAVQAVAPHAVSAPRAQVTPGKSLPVVPPETQVVEPAPAAVAPQSNAPHTPLPERARSAAAAAVPQASATPSAAFASPAGSAAPSPAQSPPASLGADLAMLDRARQALTRGDGQAALAALDTYERKRQSNVLTPEADVLRIRALRLVGQRASAATLARAFLAAHPTSSYATELKPLVQGSVQ